MKSKNSHGEGSLRQRKDGRWEFRVKVPNRKTPLSFYSTDKDGRGAKKAYREWLKETGGNAVETIQTVKQWAAVWLKTKKDAVAFGTYSNYEFYTNTYILPAIGHMKMDAVRPFHIAELYSSVSKLSNSAKNEIRVCLNGIFKSGRKNRLCLTNPAEDECFTRTPAKPPKTYTLDDVRSILDFAATHKWGHYATAALYTGMRTEELCGLMWSDIDLKEGTIRVHQVVAKAAKGEELPADKSKRVKRRRIYELRDTTKSKRERVVALNAEGLAVFQRIPKTALFVFPNDVGSFSTPPQFAHRFAAVIRDLNRGRPEEETIPALSPHKLRHTYASQLLESGCNIRSVQDQLGHAKISTTQLYLHTDLDMIKANVKKLCY